VIFRRYLFLVFFEGPALLRRGALYSASPHASAWPPGQTVCCTGSSAADANKNSDCSPDTDTAALSDAYVSNYGSDESPDYRSRLLPRYHIPGTSEHTLSCAHTHNVNCAQFKITTNCPDTNTLKLKNQPVSVTLPLIFS
jgi:hypothetical protein